ncbi:hypothetical protein I302_107906 [Kwoniella bestiolae CBS 10118]|uniref:Zn(2)-C6 fungal-type domain-containing protein n=1 Tax=Kwoniella bestiolae CBS 10118 TaxID=1296100 RepID=A0A1B9FX77_9TREE|nr:hypothetical protein I302_06352 [Kwoniella bestiolae CBS 10118]OCF23371.1 hypothetical protein I302_06352 [Kwoniella bestiolae CBS 10118]
MPAVPKHRPLARGDACQSCKARKIRCPAEKPACANCVKKNRECIYNPTPTSVSDSSPPAQPSTIPSIPTHSSSSSSIDLLSQMDINSAPSSGRPFDTLQSSSTMSTSYDSTPWSQEFNLIGVVPSMMGPVQNMPSPWDDVDITSLLAQGVLGRTEETELSVVERDHLLLLYFTGQRVFGVDMHISSFYTRLQSPDPALRPHPCLLNAMYLMTCRGSPLESLRRQEMTFLKRAKEQLDRALKNLEHVFDAIRAGTMIATWFFGVDSHMEGLAMMGMTVRLAIATGLDSIRSSVDYLCELTPGEGRKRDSPALSQLELADRIYAFWTLYLVDRCTSISFELPGGFDVQRIRTPLPRPWAEYETNDPHLTTCDQHVTDLFDDPSLVTCAQKHLPEIGYVLFAIELMYQVSLRPSSPDQERLEGAMARFNKMIPPELRQTEKSPDGTPTITADTATIQFITLCTEMLLYSIDSVDQPDPRALEAARKILGVLHLLRNANIGDINLFAVIICCRVATLLIWESKRLEASGDLFAAAPYVKDVQFISSYLQQLAHIKLAAEALVGIERCWKVDLAELKPERNVEAGGQARKLLSGNGSRRECSGLSG